MYLRFKDLSGLGVTNLLPGGDIPQGGGLETKTLLVAPMTMPSYGTRPPTPAKDAGSIGGGEVVVAPPTAPPPPPVAQTTGCVKFSDPNTNESWRVSWLNEATQYYQKMVQNAQQATRFANACQNPTSRSQLIELAKKLQSIANSGTTYFNKALNSKCAGDVESAKNSLSELLKSSEFELAKVKGFENNCAPEPTTGVKKGGSTVAANVPGSTNYGQQSDAGYSDFGYGDVLTTPMFDGGGFDSWGGGGGYAGDPGFDQFTDLEPGGGDGLSLDYTSGGDQMPGDTFGAPEIEIPQDQGIDLNLPTGNEGGMIQGKKFPWWLLLVGGAVLAMSNDGKGKKKGKR